jgi:hypothetical protein
MRKFLYGDGNASLGKLDSVFAQQDAELAARATGK